MLINAHNIQNFINAKDFCEVNSSRFCNLKYFIVGQIDRFHLIGHIILKWSHQFLKNVADNAFSVQNVALRGQWMVAVMYSHWKSSINHFILSVFLSHSSSRPRWELRTKSLKTDLQYFISNKITTFEVTKISICILAIVLK